MALGTGESLRRLTVCCLREITVQGVKQKKIHSEREDYGEGKGRRRRRGMERRQT